MKTLGILVQTFLPIRVVVQDESEVQCILLLSVTANCRSSTAQGDGRKLLSRDFEKSLDFFSLSCLSLNVVMGSTPTVGSHFDFV